MLNKPNDYDKVSAYKEQDVLPVGGYVLQVQDTRVEEYAWGNVLVLRIDIAEGEYTNFYKNNFLNQPAFNRKWKGTFRLNLSNESENMTEEEIEKNTRTIARFKSVMENFEASNPGFKWDWDETKLKGLYIGGLFNNKEYNFEGRRGFFTNLKKLVPVDMIRSGSYRVPADDYLVEKPVVVPQNQYEPPEGFATLRDDDIPF